MVQYCPAPGNFSKEIAAGFRNMSFAPSVLRMTVELPMAHHERVMPKLLLQLTAVLCSVLILHIMLTLKTCI